MNVLAKRWQEIVAKGVPAPPLTPEEQSAINRNVANAVGRRIAAMADARYELDDGTLVDGFGRPVPEEA